MEERPRHVQRLLTATQIEAEDRCLVCSRPARASYELDFAAGASTLDLSAKLPDAPMCPECVAAQARALELGRTPVLVSFFAPPVVVVAATALAPVGTPVALVVLALASVALARVVVASVARRRARESRLLYLDGAGDDVLLQVRLPPEESAPAGYRTMARELPRTGSAASGLEGEGEVVRPKGPPMRATLGFVVSCIVTFVATLVGWHGAYPLVVFDNPGPPTRVTIDGRVVHAIPAGGKVVAPLAHGAHTIAFDGKEPRPVRVHFGGSLLVSSDDQQCYGHDVYGFASTRRGPVIAIEDPRDARRETCPPPRPVLPWTY